MLNGNNNNNNAFSIPSSIHDVKCFSNILFLCLQRPDTLATAAMPSLLPSLDSMPNPGTKFNGQSPRPNNYQSPRNGQLEEVVTPPEQPMKLNPIFESQKTKVNEVSLQIPTYLVKPSQDNK